MDITNFYNLIPTELSAAIIALNIILAFGTSYGVIWMYRVTHRGLSYSQSFLITIVLVGVLGSMIMMVVQQNIVGAFALLGAFSLIRFRTIVKDTKDVAFVFFSLVEGVAVGTSNYALAFIGLVLVSAIVYFIHHARMGTSPRGGYLLLFHAEPGFESSGIDVLFRKYADMVQMLHIKSLRDGSEYSYALRMKDGAAPESLIAELKQTPHVGSIDILTGKETVEY